MCKILNTKFIKTRWPLKTRILPNHYSSAECENILLTEVFRTGGKPSTWFPPGELVEQDANGRHKDRFFVSPHLALPWLASPAQAPAVASAPASSRAAAGFDSDDASDFK